MRAMPTQVVLAFLWVALPAAATDFMGAESCKACHAEAYAAWRTSKHARAYESLTEQQRKDARCVSCHAPDLASQGVAGVSCETCHGGGQHYAPEYVMRDPELSRLVGLVDPSEKQCRVCHDASSPSLQPFHFGDKLKLIDHWTAERKRRSEEAPPAPAPAPPPKKRPRTQAPSPEAPAPKALAELRVKPPAAP
jgi:hypothetical protein